MNFHYLMLESDPYTASSVTTDGEPSDSTNGRNARYNKNKQLASKKKLQSALPWTYNLQDRTYYGEWDD